MSHFGPNTVCQPTVPSFPVRWSNVKRFPPHKKERGVVRSPLLRKEKIATNFVTKSYRKDGFLQRFPSSSNVKRTLNVAEKKEGGGTRLHYVTCQRKTPS